MLHMDFFFDISNIFKEDKMRETSAVEEILLLLCQPFVALPQADLPILCQHLVRY